MAGSGQPRTAVRFFRRYCSPSSGEALTATLGKCPRGSLDNPDVTIEKIGKRHVLMLTPSRKSVTYG